MSIEAKLKKIIPNNRNIEYTIQDTEEILNDEIYISTDDICEIVEVQEYAMPKKLVLSGIISASPVKSETVLIREENGISLSPCKLYSGEKFGPNTACENVSIDYKNTGYVLYENGSKEEIIGDSSENYQIKFEQNKIYTHQFTYQTDTKILEQYVKNQDGFLREKCKAGINLRAYGGRYIYGSDISSIEQTFFQITNNENKTGIKISDKSLWNENGIDPIKGGYIGEKICRNIFQLDTYKFKHNLAEAIYEGFVEVKLYDKFETEYIFKSIGYKQIEKTNVVDIIFIA